MTNELSMTPPVERDPLPSGSGVDPDNVPDSGSEREGRLQARKHREMSDIDCRQLAAFDLCCGGNHIIAKTNSYVGSPVAAHELGCPPGDPIVGWECPQRGEEAPHLPALLSAHPSRYFDDAHDARRQRACGPSCLQHPLPRGRHSPKMRNEHVRVDEDHRQ